jgi:hypothetical protein
MIDLITATQDAIYAALNVPAITSQWPVFQHVPEGTKPPYIVVADIDAEPGQTKGSQDITVDIVSVHVGKGRRPLLAMMHAVFETLDGQPIVAAGAELEAPRWLGAETSPAEDGVTYGGLQQFSVAAEPA